MVQRNIRGTAFYTRRMDPGCGKLAVPRKRWGLGPSLAADNDRPEPLFPFAVHFGSLCLSGKGTGRHPVERTLGKGSPMRVYALNQLAFFATAAAIVFVGAIVVGLI
jgi:hypothetical protein